MSILTNLRKKGEGLIQHLKSGETQKKRRISPKKSNSFVE